MVVGVGANWDSARYLQFDLIHQLIRAIRGWWDGTRAEVIAVSPLEAGKWLLPLLLCLWADICQSGCHLHWRGHTNKHTQCFDEDAQGIFISTGCRQKLPAPLIEKSDSSQAHFKRSFSVRVLNSLLYSNVLNHEGETWMPQPVGQNDRFADSSSLIKLL